VTDPHLTPEAEAHATEGLGGLLAGGDLLPTTYNNRAVSPSRSGPVTIVREADDARP
jgi:hypothetical protein